MGRGSVEGEFDSDVGLAGCERHFVDRGGMPVEYGVATVEATCLRHISLAASAFLGGTSEHLDGAAGAALFKETGYRYARS